MFYGAPAPHEYWEWSMCERFGWTLSDVRSLSIQDLHDHFQIDDAVSKWREQNKAKKPWRRR